MLLLYNEAAFESFHDQTHFYSHPAGATVKHPRLKSKNSREREKKNRSKNMLKAINPC